MEVFSEKKWWSMCNADMSQPVSLSKAILTKPFIYCREHGLFYVGPSSHQQAMSLLLSWKHGLNNGVKVADKLGLLYSEGTADMWLHETPGATVLSSVGNVPYAWNKENLNAYELRWFGKVDFLFK